MSPELFQQIKNTSAGKTTTSVRGLAKEFLVYSESHCAPSTMPARRSRINKFIEFLEMADIYDIDRVNNGVLEIYFQQLPYSGKKTSKNATRTVIKTFINWVEGFKEIDTPIRLASIRMDKPSQRQPRYLLASEIDPVIDALDIPYVDRLIIVCAFRLGLRVSELSNLKVNDFKTDEMHVIGKGDAERIVPIPSVVSTMVRTYIELAPYKLDANDYIFQSFSRGEWRKMTPKTIWLRTKKVFMAKTGYDISPHWMRRSYAVDLLLRGCDIITVQKALGHKDLKVTQIYAELSDEIVKKQIRKYLG